MSAENLLEKRIKRQVTAREREFFVATGPGLAHVCQAEFSKLNEELPRQSVKPETLPGGLTFTGKVHLACQANLHLRTANRVLMRIDQFKATNFRRLEKKIGEFAWELYLFSNSPIQINVSSAQSRLYHGEAVSERFQEGIRRRLTEHGFAADNRVSSIPQAVYVRISDDMVTISLDSSGEILHKRGIKTDVGSAPLRETTAAAALMLAGYKPGEPLIDPMCGSGTFSIEGALMALRIPPGWFRSFAFTGWPCFKPRRFEHMRRKAEEKIRKIPGPVVFASDLDTGPCGALEKCLKKAGLSEAARVAPGTDFFKLEPRKLTPVKGTVAINPPYGHRMGSRHEIPALQREIVKKLISDYTGWKLALISSEPDLLEKFPPGLKSVQIFHGGLNLHLVHGRILF